MGDVHKTLFLAHFHVSTVPTSVYTFQSLAPYHPLEVSSLHARSSRCASKGLSLTRRSKPVLAGFPYSTRLSPVLPAESILVAQTKGKSVQRIGCQLTDIASR